MVNRCSRDFKFGTRIVNFLDSHRADGESIHRDTLVPQTGAICLECESQGYCAV